MINFLEMLFMMLFFAVMAAGVVTVLFIATVEIMIRIKQRQINKDLKN